MCSAKTVEPHQECHKCTDEQCDDSSKNNSCNNNTDCYDMQDVEAQKGEQQQQQQEQELHPQQQQTVVHDSLLWRQRGKQRNKRQWQSTCGTRRRAGIKWKIIISTIILLLCRISEYNTYK